MSTEENKKIVVLAFQHLIAGDVAALFDMIHDEGSWSVPYSSERFPFSGSWSKEAMRGIMTEYRSSFDRFSISVAALTADEDRVVMEGSVEGDGPGTAKYRNVLCITVKLKDGKMHTIREFFDPFQVLAYTEQLGEGRSDRLLAAAAGD